MLWIHAFSVAGLILFPFPGWGVLAGAYALMLLGGFGTTVGYHRALAHKAVRLHPAVQFVLTALAIFNGSGAPASWTANHRLHHAKTDTDGDISSPRMGGFWWSHLRWLWQCSRSPVERWAPDLNTPYWRFWNRWQIPILALSFCVGLPFGWPAFFWLGALRLTFSLHGQAFVNSVAHMKRSVRKGEDSSQNLLWLGFFQSFIGENWHGNHHARPNSARIGWHWWQPDLGWYLIWTLEKARLATQVRRPKAA